MGKKVAFLNITQGRVNRGGETYVAELASRLKKKFEVEIIAGNKTLPLRLPFIWRFFIDFQGLIVFFWTLSKIAKILRERYDFVIPVNGGWQPALVRIVTWIYGGKMIISGQSGAHWDDLVNIWSFPNYFVPISSAALVWAKKVNPFVKSVYIPNGVDLNKFKPSGLSYDTELKRPLIICVGALVPQKRIDLVIKAVSKIKNASLLVVGDGELRDRIKDQGDRELRGRFMLMKAKHDEMPEIYRSADVFCLFPEGSESFGIVYVEAMASGLPVVAIDDEVRREIVGDAGVLVKNPEDITECTESIKKALNMRWGSKPHDQAKKFDWDEIAKKYEELFEKISRLRSK